MDDVGQVSAEFLIIAGIVVALALFLFQSLQGTAEKAQKTFEKKADKLLNEIEDW